MHLQISQAASACRRPPWRRWRAVRGLHLLLVALLAFAWTIGEAGADSPTLADRVIVPKRAPEDVRATDLSAVDAALGRRVAVPASIQRDDLLQWLRHGGKPLSKLLSRAGLDPERLLLGALDDPADGVGGPFIALPTEDGEDFVALDTQALVARVLETVPLTSPVRADHRFTSPYGPRRDPFHGRRAFHSGIDLAAPLRTPIYATAGGAVKKVGRRGGYGNLIEIDHGNGVVTRYAHLYAYLVRRGDTVTSGERIGLMGRTGRATGVHLHYEVVVDGQHVDPAAFLDVGRELVAANR